LARGNVVDGGEFWDNRDTSIAVAEGADTTIKNVLVHDSQSGFRAYREAFNTTIESCVIRNVTSYGIRGTVEVSGKESVQIRATDRAGNAARTEIELR